MEKKQNNPQTVVVTVRCCELQAMTVERPSFLKDAEAELLNCAPVDADVPAGPVDGSPVAADPDERGSDDVFGDGSPDPDDPDYDPDCDPEDVDSDFDPEDDESDEDDDGEDDEDDEDDDGEDDEDDEDDDGEDDEDYRYTNDDDLTQEDDDETLRKDRIKAIDKADNWGDFN